MLFMDLRAPFIFMEPNFLSFFSGNKKFRRKSVNLCHPPSIRRRRREGSDSGVFRGRRKAKGEYKQEECEKEECMVEDVLARPRRLTK